jgi:hypothetical protein
LQTEPEIAESRSVREHQNRFYALAQKLLDAKSVTIVKRVLLAPLSAVHLRGMPNQMPLGLACLSVAGLRTIQRQTYMIELYILKLLCLNIVNPPLNTGFIKI